MRRNSSRLFSADDERLLANEALNTVFIVFWRFMKIRRLWAMLTRRAARIVEIS